MTVSCRACGAPIDEELDASDRIRTPCSQCGSTVRAFHAHFEAAATAGDPWKRRVRRRRGGQSRPYKDETDGDDLQRSIRRWMHLTRTIDRENDWYSEKVVDPHTGEVVHKCDEPLSAHRGHGSDKR